MEKSWWWKAVTRWNKTKDVDVDEGRKVKIVSCNSTQYEKISTPIVVIDWKRGEKRFVEYWLIANDDNDNMMRVMMMGISKCEKQ